MLLSWGLRKIVNVGALTLIDAHGRTHKITNGGEPSCTIRLHKPSLHLSLVTNPWLHVGEAYMDGTLTIEEGTLGDFLEIVCLSASAAKDLPVYRLTQWLSHRTRWLQQHNPVGQAQNNIAICVIDESRTNKNIVICETCKSRTTTIKFV